jgi:two-component system OmpR family response regulator
MAHLLIVEDDDLLRDGLQTQMVQAGHSALAVGDGRAAQGALEAGHFDGVLLDLGLPLVDGMEVLRWLRQRQPALPVLILTARDSIDDRIAGLNAGADDYLTKPFNMAELQARVGGMLRRSKMPAFGVGTSPAAPAMSVLRLDPNMPLGWLNDQPLELTQREWSLLLLLVNHAGQVVSREDVLATWQAEPQDSGVGSNALEVYVHRLRRKLQDSSLSIRNVRGLGYLLETTTP